MEIVPRAMMEVMMTIIVIKIEFPCVIVTSNGELFVERITSWLFRIGKKHVMNCSTCAHSNELVMPTLG